MKGGCKGMCVMESLREEFSLPLPYRSGTDYSCREKREDDAKRNWNLLKLGYCSGST